MSEMAYIYQITGVTLVYSTVCSEADQWKHQSYASLAFVRGIHLWSVNSLHKGPITRKMFPFDDVILLSHDIQVEQRAMMQRFTQLLHQLLPPSVADRLTSGEKVEPESFSHVTIYFSDIVSFTNLSAESSSHEIVDLLNDLYSIFDTILDKHDTYKVSRNGHPNVSGDFTKYGQPVPRPDPTWGVGIAHYQLWGWRYPSCAQTVPFFSVWIYLPSTWSNQLNQS